MKRDPLSDCLRRGAVLILFAASVAALPTDGAARAEETDAQAKAEADEAETNDQTAEEKPAEPESGVTLEALGTVLGKFVGINAGDFDSYEEELSPLLGEPAPEIELSDTDEQPWKLSDEQGRVVVLDFWATWCGPCVAAMPKLQTLSEEFADNPVTVVGVNQGEDLEEVKEFLEEKGYTYPQMLDPDSEAGDQFEVSGIPQIVLIDAGGIVQSVHVGFSPDLEATLSEQITALLNGDQLYDEEEVAEAREKRAEATREARQQVAEHHPERLVELSRTEVEDGLYFEGVQPNPWFSLPVTGERAAVLDAGNDRVLLLVPVKQAAKTVELPLDDMTYLQVVSAAVVEQKLHFAALTYVYDQSTYEYTQAKIYLFDQQGEEVWSAEVPMLGEYQSSEMAVADLDGDGNSEIAMLVEYEDIDFGADAPNKFRVLTLLDDDGQLVCRRWIEGHAGTGILTAQGNGRDELLIAEEDSLLRIGYDPAAAAAELE
ncbi:MAG: TlpA disulfide reductase family protein [Planctomycetota bacterium]